MTHTDLQEIYKRVPPNYYESGIKNNLFQKIWHEREFRGITELIESNSKHVLDIGCNSGLLTYRVSKYIPKATITAIDISDELISYAKKKYKGSRIKFLCADATNLPFDKYSFDFIICNEVLDHLVEPVKALKEINRCLNKDGYLILTLSSLSLLFNLVWFFWTRCGPGRVWHDTHLHRWQQSYLNNVLDKSGLYIQDKYTDIFGMLNILKIKKK